MAHYIDGGRLANDIIADGEGETGDGPVLKRCVGCGQVAAPKRGMAYPGLL